MSILVYTFSFSYSTCCGIRSYIRLHFVELRPRKFPVPLLSLMYRQRFVFFFCPTRIVPCIWQTDYSGFWTP